MRIQDLLRTLKAERDAKAEQWGFDSVDEESEAQKRNQTTTAGAGVKKADKPGPDHWYKKPVPVIVIGVTIFLIGTAIRYVLKHGFDLDV